VKIYLKKKILKIEKSGLTGLGRSYEDRLAEAGKVLWILVFKKTKTIVLRIP
jgi:hypothetical protein